MPEHKNFHGDHFQSGGLKSVEASNHFPSLKSSYLRTDPPSYDQYFSLF